MEFARRSCLASLSASTGTPWLNPGMRSSRLRASLINGSTYVKFLVTGGTGFIGSYLVPRLACEGHSVVCLDCSPLQAGYSGQVDALQCDVGDQAQVAAAFRDAQPIDRVIHLAYVMGAESEADPTLAMRVNALGTANIFDASCRARVSRLIFL